MSVAVNVAVAAATIKYDKNIKQKLISIYCYISPSCPANTVPDVVPEMSAPLGENRNITGNGTRMLINSALDG